MLGEVTHWVDSHIQGHSKCHPNWEKADRQQPQSTVTFWGHHKGHHLREGEGWI